MRRGRSPWPEVSSPAPLQTGCDPHLRVGGPYGAPNSLRLALQVPLAILFTWVFNSTGGAF